MSDITELKNILLSYFDNHQLMKMSKTLSIIWNDPSFSLEQKLDILGDLTLRDSEYFMKNIYPFRPISTKNLRSGSVALYEFYNSPFPLIIKLEEYILRNYCFLEGEEIKTVFHGELVDKKTVTLGSIYLTNYRIIVSGKQTVKSAKPISFYRPGLAQSLIVSGITKHRKAVRKDITNGLRQDLKERNIGEWGYYFPIYNAKNIKRGKNSVSYAIQLETEKKRITLKINITPRILKGQSKQEFQEQKENILNQIEDLLTHYQ